MESSRRWWIRPAWGTVLGLVVVTLLVGAARGRATVQPIEPTALPPAAARAVGPADVELVDVPTPEVSTTPTPTPTPIATTTLRVLPTTASDEDHDDDDDDDDDEGEDRDRPEPRQTPKSKPRSTPKPTPTPTCRPSSARPVVKIGWLGNLRDARIDESSGLTMSTRHADLAYTTNDEGESPQVFAIQPSTGRTVSAFDLRGAGDLRDPEAIRSDPRGRIWLADTGDGHPGKPGKKNGQPDRKHVTIVVFDEPERGRRGAVPSRRYSVVFSNGPHNAEALAIHPTTGQAFLISNAKVGRVYQLPNPLRPGRNVARATAHLMPSFVTDATFTVDGRFVLVRTMGSAAVLVFDSRSWKRVGSIAAPRMDKGESITVERGGTSAILGSEGRRSPLVRLALPASVKRHHQQKVGVSLPSC